MEGGNGERQRKGACKINYNAVVIQDMCRYIARTQEAATAKLFTRNQCRSGKC